MTTPDPATVHLERALAELDDRIAAMRTTRNALAALIDTLTDEPPPRVICPDCRIRFPDQAAVDAHRRVAHLAVTP